MFLYIVLLVVWSGMHVGDMGLMTQSRSKYFISLHACTVCACVLNVVQGMTVIALVLIPGSIICSQDLLM